MSAREAGPSPPTPFGVLLRHHRIAAGLTQEELAERARISVRRLGDLERGVRQLPRKDTVDLLAQALALAPPDHAAFVEAARALDATAPLLAPGGATTPPFVGRAAELALLERHLAGQGPPILLFAGEPGIGKTRLLEAVVPRAIAQGYRVLEGGSQRQGGQEPYTPLLEALQRHLRTLRPAELRQALQGCAWLVRLLPELAAGPIEPLPAWTLPPEQERRLLAEALKRVLTNVAGPAGTLLLLDDLQWASPDALDRLALLARAAGEIPLRVVGAYRDTEVQADDLLVRTLADLEYVGLASQQRLGSLTPDEAAALLVQLAPDQIQQATRERVLQRADGVPFFLVSWAQSLRERGSAEVAATTGQGDAPWSVVLGVRQRMAALQDRQREVLELAAVVGRVVSRPLLAQVAGQAEPEFVAALEAVCRARLLEETGAHGYQFTHDVIREVVEAGLSTARRALLHRRVATALSSGPGDPPLDEVAYHYAHTEDHAAAALWLERAGDRAVATLAPAAALEYFGTARDRAVAGGLDAAVRSRLEAKLGDLYLLRFDLGRAQASFARARAAETDGVRRADLWRKEGTVRRGQGDVSGALAAFAAAEQEGSVTVPLPAITQAAVCIERAYAYYFLSEFDAAEAEVGRAFVLLGESPPSATAHALLARGAWAQAVIHDIHGEPEQGRANAEVMLVNARAIGDQQFIGRALFGLGVCAWRMVQLDRAEAQIRAAQATLEPLDEKEFLAGCVWCLGVVALTRGDLPAAERHFLQGLTLVDPATHPFYAGVLLEELGKVACARGDLQSAEDSFTHSLEARRRIGDQRGIAHAWTGLGMVAYARQDLSRAANWCCRARRQARRYTASIAEVDATVEQIRVHLRLLANGAPARWRLRLLTALLAHGRALAARHTLPEATLWLALLSAELHLRQGAPARARQIATEALRQAVETGLRRHEALARRLLGECDLAEGHATDAVRHLRAALTLLSDLGFVLDADHARMLLAQAHAGSGDFT